MRLWKQPETKLCARCPRITGADGNHPLLSSNCLQTTAAEWGLGSFFHVLCMCIRVCFVLTHWLQTLSFFFMQNLANVYFFYDLLIYLAASQVLAVAPGIFPCCAHILWFAAHRLRRAGLIDFMAALRAWLPWHVDLGSWTRIKPPPHAAGRLPTLDHWEKSQSLPLSFYSFFLFICWFHILGFGSFFKDYLVFYLFIILWGNNQPLGWSIWKFLTLV